MDLNADTPVAAYLNSILTLKYSVRDDKRYVVKEDVYSSRFYFQVSAADTHRVRLFICPTRIIRFNSYVQRMMYYTLFEVVDWFTAEGMQEKEAIYMFINRYRLYDMNFDSLKKACTRRRTKLNIPTLNQRKSPFFCDSIDGSEDNSAPPASLITHPDALSAQMQHSGFVQGSLF